MLKRGTHLCLLISTYCGVVAVFTSLAPSRLGSFDSIWGLGGSKLTSPRDADASRSTLGLYIEEWDNGKLFFISLFKPEVALGNVGFAYVDDGHDKDAVLDDWVEEEGCCMTRVEVGESGGLTVGKLLMDDVLMDPRDLR